MTLLPVSPINHGSGLQIERNKVYGPPCGFITALLLSQQRVHLGLASPSALALFLPLHPGTCLEQEVRAIEPNARLAASLRLL